MAYQILVIPENDSYMIVEDGLGYGLSGSTVEEIVLDFRPGTCLDAIRAGETTAKEWFTPYSEERKAELLQKGYTDVTAEVHAALVEQETE